MIALTATSDELHKYPMARDRLKKYAGPQCFPHLNPRSAEYRVLANEEPSGEGGVDALGGGGGVSYTPGDAILQERSWLQCCRCNKWRLVSQGCVAALGGESYFSVRPTDMDWESWLRGAAVRYTASEVAQDRGDAVCAAGAQEASDGVRDSGQNQKVGGGGEEVGVGVAAGSRKRFVLEPDEVAQRLGKM